MEYELISNPSIRLVIVSDSQGVTFQVQQIKRRNGFVDLAVTGGAPTFAAVWEIFRASDWRRREPDVRSTRSLVSALSEVRK